VFPVHPRLSQLGLLDFIAAQPDGFLWPSPPRVMDEVRNASHNLSRYLNRKIDAAGIATAKKAQHSFRHTVMQRLGDADVPLHITKAIVGHANRDITTGVYGARPTPAKMLAALSKLTLPI
jgi:integrase